MQLPRILSFILVNFIIDIDSSHLLIGATDGLYVLDLDEFYQSGQEIVKVFNHHNGFTAIEPGQNGAFKDSKGHIWITSSTVVTKLDPKKLDLTVNPLQTRIKSINDQEITYTHSNEIIRFEKNKNTVQFEVEAIGFERPLKTEYAYFLEGK